MNIALANAWKHPKTTLMGIGTTLIGGYMLVQNDPDYLPLKTWVASHGHWAGKVATGALMLKLFLALGSKDTGREETRQGMQDSHEIPNTGAPVVPKETRL